MPVKRLLLNWMVVNSCCAVWLNFPSSEPCSLFIWNSIDVIMGKDPSESGIVPVR